SVGSANNIEMSDSLLGNGEIHAPLTSTGGVFTPGKDVGDIGIVAVDGPLTLDSATILGMEIDAGTKTNDQINVGDAVHLNDAELFVSIGGDYSSLLPSDSFVILSGSTIDGQLTIDFPDRVIAYDLDGNPIGDFEVDYTGTQVVLTDFLPEPNCVIFGLLGLS